MFKSAQRHPVSLRHEFHGSCADPQHNGEASHADVNGTLKEKLDNYQHDYNDYNARNYFFLPAVMMTSGRISGDFLRLLYIPSHRQAANYNSNKPPPFQKTFSQARGGGARRISAAAADVPTCNAWLRQPAIPEADAGGIRSCLGSLGPRWQGLHRWRHGHSLVNYLANFGPDACGQGEREGSGYTYKESLKHPKETEETIKEIMGALDQNRDFKQSKELRRSTGVGPEG